jgi:hypothetical protein
MAVQAVRFLLFLITLFFCIARFGHGKWGYVITAKTPCCTSIRFSGSGLLRNSEYFLVRGLAALFRKTMNEAQGKDEGEICEH